MRNLRQELAQESRRRRRREVLLSSISIALALLLTVSGLFVTLNGRGNFANDANDARLRDEIRTQTIALQKAREEVDRSLMESRVMQDTFFKAARQRGTVLYKEGLSPQDREQIDKISAAQDDLSGQLTRLNDAILQTPEKAAAIPVLKQQISDLQDKYRGDNDAMHAEIGRLYTMMSIFFGSMVALIVGVGGLFFSIFKQRSDRIQRSELNHKNLPPQDGGAQVA
jgi:hypothetical protein